MNGKRRLTGLIVRLLMVALTFGILSVWIEKRLKSEDDILQSIVSRDPERAAYFEAFQTKSFFKDKIFIDFGSVSTGQKQSIIQKAESFGYRKTEIFPFEPKIFTVAFLPMVGPEKIKAHFTTDAIKARVSNLTTAMALPGGSALAKTFEQDPLGLTELTFEAVKDTLGFQGGAAESFLQVFQSPPTQNLDHVGELYDALINEPGLHFMGSDFFAYENYRAIKADIQFCMTISLILNIALFVFFTRSLRLPAFLFFGSLVSVVLGLAVLLATGAKIYGVVLAFTSTFVSYNCETMVHLSSLDPDARKKHLLAITSALGTTLIGFLILLAADSPLIRQAAMVSIGGTLGFFALVLLFQDQIQSIEYRKLSWPSLSIGRKGLFAMAGLCLLAVASLGLPKVATRVEEFRYQSERLTAELAFFNAKASAFQMAAVYAVPTDHKTPSQIYDAYHEAAVRAGVKAMAHPMAVYRAESDQQATLSALYGGYEEALLVTESALKTANLKLNLTLKPPSIMPLTERGYMKLTDTLAPIRLYNEDKGHSVMYLTIPDEAVPQVKNAGIRMLAISPKIYADQVLTESSQQMAILFGIGLLLQILYLLFVQRSLVKVVYVFLPLLYAAVAALAYFKWTGAAVHAVHLMGFGLILGVSVDYSSVAVSTDHDSKELNKILLTGLATLASFGVLIGARHPLLRDLGQIVTSGTAVSLLIALGTRLNLIPKGDSNL